MIASFVLLCPVGKSPLTQDLHLWAFSLSFSMPLFLYNLSLLLPPYHIPIPSYFSLRLPIHTRIQLPYFWPAFTLSL